MKNKLKYLLFGLLTLVSLSSTTHAITLRDYTYGSTYTYYSTSNGYNLYKNGNFVYGCISTSVVASPDNDKRYTKGPAICDDGTYKSVSHYSSSAPILKGSSRLYSSYKATYYYNNDSRYIFSISAVEVGDEIKIHKSKFKISSSGIYNIKSKRGSNVYSVASMRGPGMTFIMKDGDQVRWATYVNNMYMLDGYAISLPQGGSSFVFDSYKNKAYEYKEFWTSQDNDLRGTSLFPKLMNTVPTNVYNIEWNVGSDYSAYYSTSSDTVKFSLMEKRAGTKEDLKTIQKDLKDSITSLNEYSHYYLGLTPEDLQGISGTPKVPDGAKSENNTTNATEAQYNQCIAKYTNMRALTAHSDGCFGTDYNNEERMKYWHDVIDDSDDKYTTRDKTRYWRCYMFANYKAGLKKKLGEARDPFRKEWKSEYLGLEAKDVNPELLCGSKPSSSKKEVVDNKTLADGIGNFIGGMFRDYGEGTGFNYLEKTEYFRERTVCALFGWFDEDYCSKLTDKNSKNRYVKKDQQDGLDHSSGFSFFFRKMQNEFEKGKKFLISNKCTNTGFGKEWDMILYVSMILVLFSILRILKNG